MRHTRRSLEVVLLSVALLLSVRSSADSIAFSTAKLVFFLAGGIALFGAVIQIFTLLAG